MTYTPTVVTHTESHNYDQSIVEAPTSNDPVNHDLINAAHCYARAFTAAKEALDAVQSSELALAHSDIEAVEAFNAERSAKAAAKQAPANEIGFTAENDPQKATDFAALDHAAEVAALHYQQRRAISMRAELNAEQATHAVDAAQARLVETARRLATREIMTA
jgi:mannose-6-phosphate isomerase class I